MLLIIRQMWKAIFRNPRQRDFCGRPSAHTELMNGGGTNDDPPKRLSVLSLPKRPGVLRLPKRYSGDEVGELIEWLDGRTLDEVKKMRRIYEATQPTEET